MPAEDEGEEEEEVVVNPLAEHLKEELARPRSRLQRRESVSKLFDRSATFATFRKGKDGEGGGGKSPSRSLPGGDDEARKRSDSARQWDDESGMRAEAELNAYLQEQGGGSIGQSFASVAEGDVSAHGQQMQGEDSMQQESAEMGASGDDYEEGGDYTSWAVMQEDSFGPEPTGAHNASVTVDHDMVIKKRMLGGTVSTYKHKHELRSELERKAGLKYITERRQQVKARDAVAKAAEEKVAIAQGHVDECETKMAKLREEAEQLNAADHFANRDRVRALHGRVASLGEKLREAEAELAREAEIEYLARREYNNAEIELRKVEELEPELMMEEELSNAEQRVLAHVRAEKEREAALRLEHMRQKRQKAAAEQRQKDSQKTQEAAGVAKAGRVAAIKRLKEAKGTQDNAKNNFEDTRLKEREERAGALLELKANMEAAADRIRGGNERQYKKMRAVEAARKAEKAEIMAAGGNPYAVWRQQEQAKKADKAQRQREQNMKEMENRLLHQLMEEEARRKEKEKHEHEHKILIKEFQAQMGGSAKQKAVVDYMKARTVGGKDVLDPTGREPRIYPSKATGA
jgi:hypothetical protein